MATIALSTLRSRLRIMLNDENSKTWPNDSTLDLFLNLAIRKYSTDVPVSSYKTYTVATDQTTDAHTYTLPDDFTRDYFVRGYFEISSEQENILRANLRPGSWDTGDEPRVYFIDWPNEGNLYLARESLGSTFTLYYGAQQSTWLDDDADTYDLGRNLWGEQAVYAYSAFLAFNPSSARRAQLEQWARRSDLKVGNPLEEEANRWLALYNSLIAMHAEVPIAFEFVEAGIG